MRKHTRLVECHAREAASGRPRTLTFIASTEDRARDGDIVRVDGWDVENYRKNPVFLWMHDPTTPPLGKAVEIRKVTSGDDRRLEIDVEFAGLAEEHDVAETVYQLYRGGFLRAVSVGFIPRKRLEMSDEEKAEIGLGPWNDVWIEQELLELSAVSVPADPGALVVGDAKAMEPAVLMARSAAGDEHRDGWDAILEALRGGEALEDAGPALEEPEAEYDPEPIIDPAPALTDEQMELLAEEIAKRVTVRVVSDLGEVMDEGRGAVSLPPETDAPEPQPDPWATLAAELRKGK